MRLARRQVELAAASRSSVLLVGPPGSGRQHLAAAIHYGGEAKGAIGRAQMGTAPFHRADLCRWIARCLGEDLLEAAAAAVAHGGSDDAVAASGG